VFDERFAGRVAVVTGGASGAGLATARRIVTEGGKAALWDFNPAALDAARAEINGVLTVAVDVTDASQVDEAAARTIKAFGQVDVLMNSAGVTGPTTPVLSYPREDWRRIVDIHLHGTFYCCQALIPQMVERGYGRVVNVASVAGKEGNPNLSAYSAAKAAVIGFTKSLGKELATTGVLVNTVTPAVFRTALLDQMPQQQIDYMVGKIPMGRLGEVDEIVAMVCWLLSSECTFSTAATFDISGGRTTY
jgi:2-dehydro-3-deoxy-L-rhamnonate dehydrogenase (NAD+)